MTTKARTRTIAVEGFNANCLALLDDVAATGETLIVTTRGRPGALLRWT